MDIIAAGGALTTPAPTACASCVFGAYSSKILSFTSTYISHITVSVTPHITVYTNGSRSTSFESNTLTKSEIVGGIAGSNSSKTFSKKNDIVWTVDGATLTYPTSYVQYLGFSGAPAATDGGDICAEKTDAHAISLPATTDAASFIYALPANATGLALPTQLLQYLGGLDDLVEQFDGAALTGCAPLNGGLSLGSNGSVPYPVAGNGSYSGSSDYTGPSGYASPSGGVGSHPIPLPSGYVGVSSGLPSPDPHASGYVGSSSSSEYHPSLKPTGYASPSTGSSTPAPPTYSSYAGGLGTGFEPLPPMSILPVLSGMSSSSSASDSDAAITSSSTSDGEFSSVAAPVPYSSSRPASPSSQSPRSDSKFSILPYPYLNTTRSEVPSSSDSVSFSVPASTSAITTASVTETASSASGHSSASSFSRTSTFTAPGGIFIPSHVPGGNDAGEQPPPSTSATTTTTEIQDNPPPPPPPPIPPKGNNGNPEDVPPADDDDGLDDASSTFAAPSTPAEYTPPPALETPPEVSQPSSANGEGENVHTTAFVIEPITGQALITYQSAPTKTSDDGRAPAYTGGDDGNDGNGAGGDQNVAEPTQTPDPDVSNLVGQIGQIANGGQDATDGSSDGSGSSGSDSSNSSPGQESAGQNSPGEIVKPAGQDSSESPSNSNGQPNDSPGQDGGLDLGQLNSAINSVANGAVDGDINGAQATSPSNAGSQPGSVYSAGNTVVTAQPGGNVVIGEQTVAPGQSITIGSGSSTTIVALQTNGKNTDLVVAGSTFAASPGNSAVTAQSNGAVVFGDSTVQLGESVTIGSGPSATVVALQTNGGSTNLVVGGSTVNVLPAGSTITAGPDAVTGVSSIALITTNGQTITAIQSGSSLILQSGTSSTTVAAGDAATFAGETIFAVPTEDAVFVNGNITPLTAAESVEGASQAVITANGHTITAMDSGNSVVLVEGSVTKTLQAGADLVFQEQTISAQESGMAVVVNGHTSSLTSAIALATGQALVTAGGHKFSVLDLPGYVVLQDGTSSLTIRDGATATFDGRKITALTNGDAVVVDGTTMSMTEPIDHATAEAVITAGRHTFTALDMDSYIVLQDGSTTITVKDGSTATFEGQTIKALSSGEAILVNGRTTSLISVEASATPNLDDYINRGLSGGSSTSSQTVDVSSPEPTGTPDSNAASVLSTGWVTLAVACLFGVVAML